METTELELYFQLASAPFGNGIDSSSPLFMAISLIRVYSAQFKISISRIIIAV